jgi:hypothetical protein
MHNGTGEINVVYIPSHNPAYSLKEKTMKNKFLMLAMVGLIAVSFVVLSGCPSGIQEVKLVYDRAPAVESVAIVQFTTGSGEATRTYVVVSWDAVEDAGGYYVYGQEVGTKTAPSQLGSGQNALSYSTSDISSASNSLSDKWSFRTEVTNYTPERTYRIGVMTRPLYNPGTSSAPSEITWAKTQLTIVSYQ